jgi:phenylpropionate dioxygenase-like ring-hydroxylating dioxygenase large terminal subunit
MNMQESSGDLINYWYAAALSKSLKPGNRLGVTIFETPLVLWRDQNRVVHALLDRCLHRNAPLSSGKVEKNCIVCPYHGWTYNQDGQCVKIPSEGADCQNISKRQIPKFNTMESGELIWVWMGNGKPDKSPFEMPLMAQKGWRHYYMVTDFDNGVTNLVENFMDVPHTVFVHKGWFRDERKIAIKATVSRTEDSVLVTYDQPNDSIGFTSWLVNPKGLPMKHTDNFYMPNNTRVDYIFGEEARGFIITSTCTPISPFKTRVFTLITYKFGWLTPVIKPALNAYTRQVINQDVWIMKLQGDHLQKFPKADFTSTQCDFMHLFIESLRDHAAQPEAKAKPQPTKKNIVFWV